VLGVAGASDFDPGGGGLDLIEVFGGQFYVGRAEVLPKAVEGSFNQPG
jgi:hypothetical protein